MPQQLLPYGPSGPAKIGTSLGRRDRRDSGESATTYDSLRNVAADSFENSMSASPMVDYASAGVQPMGPGSLYAASWQLHHGMVNQEDVPFLTIDDPSLIIPPLAPLQFTDFVATPDVGTSDPFPVVPPGNWSQAASAIAAAVPTEDVAGSTDPPLDSTKTSASRDETLQRRRDEETGLCTIRWLVDASVLTKNMLQVPSPEFSLHLSDEVHFKLILEAMQTAGRGGRSFKKANGKGVVQVKCMNPEKHSDPCVRFTLSVEPPNGEAAAPRGPVTHDFSKEGVNCSLPTNDAVWDCEKCVDKETQRFAVCLEELPLEG